MAIKKCSDLIGLYLITGIATYVDITSLDT